MSQSVENDEKPTAPSEEFIHLFTRHQRQLYLLILAQLGRLQEAEEALQETNVVILSKHHQFVPGTNFFAWAAQVAHYEVLKSRQRRQRDRLRFSDEFVDAVASEVESQVNDLDLRREALQDCLGKLREKDRELIRKRYQPGASGRDEAENLGRPANSLYQSIGRIRRSLYECIRRRMASESYT
ncbi:sigma-70 family RNA polymerase sigma factor [Caulifigura coniformis]|uniref:sigma-70 family RNA polymerase sigma factor n=1 Tax=Caulifigura coniformis TaxID=2527983 RepID=UPI0011A1CFBE|nr:sigma-70 family RNA polymerase sigma factor [Caulifigura coniformis]